MTASPNGRRVLLAYFSGPGENYWNGGRRDLATGNTEVLARLIGGLVACDVYRIEAADPYPDRYDPTVQRNVREQNSTRGPPSPHRRQGLAVRGEDVRDSDTSAAVDRWLRTTGLR